MSQQASTDSSVLTPYLQCITARLLETADRADWSDSKLRSFTYETLNEVVRCFNIAESIETVAQLLGVIMDRLKKYHKSLDSSDDKEKQGDHQASAICDQMNSTDDNLMECINQLSYSIFKHILEVFRDLKMDSEVMLQHAIAVHILQSIETRIRDNQRDDNVTKAAVAVIGHLAGPLARI